MGTRKLGHAPEYKKQIEPKLILAAKTNCHRTELKAFIKSNFIAHLGGPSFTNSCIDKILSTTDLPLIYADWQGLVSVGRIDCSLLARILEMQVRHIATGNGPIILNGCRRTNFRGKGKWNPTLKEGNQYQKIA